SSLPSKKYNRYKSRPRRRGEPKTPTGPDEEDEPKSRGKAEEEVALYKSWVHISEDSVEGEGSFSLNNTTWDEEDEVHEVRPSRLMGWDQAKRKWKAGTLSASSTTGFNVKSLAKLMVNEYAIVNDPYNVQKGQDMT
ncbi:hypothetical protein Tco_1356763, partial [Tanacetum coccineum]